MTDKEIYQWALDRVKIHRDITWSLDNSAYIARFTTGETYEYKSREINSYEKEVKIFINGRLVNTSFYKWENFGWRLEKEEIAA